MPVIDFERHLIERREHTLREQAEFSAMRFYNMATEHQRAEWLAACTTAAKLFGHGSEAHGAAIDLAQAKYDDDTREAKALYDETVDWFVANGVDSLCPEHLDERWTQLMRDEQVKHAMAAE